MKDVASGFIQAFVDATIYAFKAQVGVDVVPGKVIVCDQHNEYSGDISGIISIVGDKVNGSFVISFTEETFLKVMSKMLGEAFTSLTPDILDGASEMTNIIFGKSKVPLNEKGFGIKMALPTVVSGKNHHLSSLCNGPVAVVKFESDLGGFLIKIGLNRL